MYHCDVVVLSLCDYFSSDSGFGLVSIEIGHVFISKSMVPRSAKINFCNLPKSHCVPAMFL